MQIYNFKAQIIPLICQTFVLNGYHKNGRQTKYTKKKLSRNKNTYSHKIKQKVIQSTESHKEMAWFSILIEAFQPLFS